MNPAARSIDSALECAASAETSLQTPYLERLEALYARMDQRYSEVADQCGFHCQGCEDSCCRTLFYHHTLVEYLYIRRGLLGLEKERQEQILLLSREVSAHPDAGLFCPLNEDGRCLLYAYRPMICRLHGLAHELRRPGGTIHSGSGCKAFDAATNGKPPLALDRTEFYWELSRLEKDIREALGFSQKIRMTISRMAESILHTLPGEESHFHETD